MAVEQNRPAGKLIRDLLIVLTLGMFSALLIALGTLYLVGPSGGYTAGNILLSPEVMEGLAYSEVSPQTGTSTPYTFDRIDFLYFNRETGEWRRKEVESKDYAVFYKSISDDRSMSVVPEQIETFFRSENPSTLTLLVKKQGSEKDLEVSAFQEVQILNYGDYYRVQLRDQEGGRNWAYFFHENIFEESRQSLLRPDER